MCFYCVVIGRRGVVAVVEVASPSWRQPAVVEVVAVMEVVGSRGGSRRRAGTCSRLQCWWSPVLVSQSLWQKVLVHVLTIRRPTGCYALILIHPFLLHVVTIPLCSTFLSISAKIRSGRRSCTLRNYLLQENILLKYFHTHGLV